MNENKLYAAIAGIDERILLAAENDDVLAASFRTVKQKKIMTIFLAVLSLTMFGFFNLLPFQKDPTLAQSGSTFVPEEFSTHFNQQEVPINSETPETESRLSTTIQNDNSDEPVATTSHVERNTTAQTSSGSEAITQKEDDITQTQLSTNVVSTTLLGAPCYSGSARLQAVLTENVCGWIRYNGAYYLQDDWSNGNAIENCERIGGTSDVEGNPALLGLTGDVFLVTDDDNYAGCLLLKTDAGQNIVFIPVPDAGQ